MQKTNKTIFQNREPRKGPELELVDEFIVQYFPETNGDEFVSIFIEPTLGSSRPDILLVTWRPSVVNLWPRNKPKFEILDYKILQLLFLFGALLENEMNDYLNTKSILKSLYRLSAANFIYIKTNKWELNCINSIFAVSSIITIEAKISNVSRAIDQAIGNVWFASESYVLTPHLKTTAPIEKKAKEHGIGIWNIGDFQKPYLLAKKYEVPFSYGAWQINDLIGEKYREEFYER